MTLFVSFEGGEGSGKSTQIDVLYYRLRHAGVNALVVREPGTTELGKSIRAWLKRERTPDEIVSTMSEVLLFAAARSELIEQVVKPKLMEPSAVVIADRYVDSTLAYQGYGRGHCIDQIVAINKMATDGVMPDLTILLDCDPKHGLSRISANDTPMLKGDNMVSTQTRLDPEGTRRYELEPLQFHRNVRSGYLVMADNEPERWCVLDATCSVDEVSSAVWDQVKGRLLSE